MFQPVGIVIIMFPWHSVYLPTTQNSPKKARRSLDVIVKQLRSPLVASSSPIVILHTVRAYHAYFLSCSADGNVIGCSGPWEGGGGACLCM